MKHHVVVAENLLVSDEKIKLIRDNQWLCISPFYQTEIKQDSFHANWSPCCEYWFKPEKRSIDNINDIENLKKLIKNKKIDKRCGACHNVEKLGGVSERIRYLMDASIETIEKFVNEPESISLKNLGNFPVITVKITNNCNLACRSCSGNNSSLYNIKIRRDLKTEYNIWKYAEDEVLFKNLLLETCKTNDSVVLHMIGGEVFLDDYIANMLDWCEEKNIIDKIILYVTTNATIPLDQRLTNLSKNLKSIILSLSIDSVGENYSYVRWPGKFSKIEENLILLENLRVGELKNKLTYIVQPVFSLNNVFYLKDFLDFWLDWVKKTNYYDLKIFNTHLHRPKELMIEILPNEYRKFLIPITDECVKHELFDIVSNTTQLKEWIIGINNHLKTEISQEHHFTNYLRYTAMYDKKTSQNSFILNSRLFNLLNTEDKRTYNYHSYLHKKSHDKTLD